MGQGIEGKVVWFNNAKGFGFLSRDTGPDVFCHFSSIHSDGYKSLKEGESVRYDIVDGPKGLQADNVHRVRDAARQAAIASAEQATTAAAE